MNESAAVAVGQKVSVKSPKSWPTTATVTYASDKTDIATVDATTGEVTGVKAGEATITATLVCGERTVTNSTKVTVKNYLLESVKQTKAAELEAVIAGNTKDIKATDINIVNTDTKVVYPVSKVTVDSNDTTKVTLSLFGNLTDGKNYDVTLDKVTKSFVASNGEIASINVDPITIPYATETEIKLISKDANGVILKELSYGEPDSNYDFTINANGNGYTAGKYLSLNKIGDTATAEITYKSGKYDANGKPEGNIGPNKVTITAVDQAAINNFDVRIDDAEKSFDKAKDTKQVAVEETKTAYFKIKNANGSEISDTEYSKYTIESSDKTALMLSSDMFINKSVQVMALKTGTAYIIIKDQKGTIVGSVGIDVVAKRAVASLELSAYEVTVSNDAVLQQQKEVTVTLKDQYGDKVESVTNVTATYLNSGKGATEPDGLVSVTNGVITIAGAGIAADVYNYKIAYFNQLGQEVVAKRLTIVVQTPGESVNGYRLDINKQSVDIKDADEAKTTITVNLMGTANGVDKQKMTDVTYTVTKVGGSVVTGAALEIDGSKTTLTIKPVSVSTVTTGKSIAVKNLDAGTYEVKAEWGVGTSKVTYKKTFEVKDSCGKASVEIKNVSVAPNTTIAGALQNAIVVTYNGKEYKGSDIVVSKAEIRRTDNFAVVDDKDAEFLTGSFLINKLIVQVEIAEDIWMDVETVLTNNTTITVR